MEEQAIELPPLPEVPNRYTQSGDIKDVNTLLVNRADWRDQMRDYARAAVLQERERCARVCEQACVPDGGMDCAPLLNAAAAIRKPSP
jgi:hypothetical protein